MDLSQCYSLSPLRMFWWSRLLVFPTISEITRDPLSRQRWEYRVDVLEPAVPLFPSITFPMVSQEVSLLYYNNLKFKIYFILLTGLCHTCKQTLPPAPVPLPVQASQQFMATPYFPIHCAPGITFASCSGGSTSQQQQHCGSITSLPSFPEIQQPQVTYPPRQCQQEQMTNAAITLSHPPSSTPSPLPSSSTRRDSFQQLFDSPAHPSSVGATSQSPNLSPTSSPGPVSAGNTNTNNYWNPINLVPSTVSISSVSQSQDVILQTPDFPAISATTSMSLVTSPGSEPIYSAVPSPDTTTSIFPPMMPPYLEDPNTQYRQYTSWGSFSSENRLLYFCWMVFHLEQFISFEMSFFAWIFLESALFTLSHVMDRLLLPKGPTSMYVYVIILITEAHHIQHLTIIILYRTKPLHYYIIYQVLCNILSCILYTYLTLAWLLYLWKTLLKNLLVFLCFIIWNWPFTAFVFYLPMNAVHYIVCMWYKNTFILIIIYCHFHLQQTIY